MTQAQLDGLSATKSNLKEFIEENGLGKAKNQQLITALWRKSGKDYSKAYKLAQQKFGVSIGELTKSRSTSLRETFPDLFEKAGRIRQQSKPAVPVTTNNGQYVELKQFVEKHNLHTAQDVFNKVYSLSGKSYPKTYQRIQKEFGFSGEVLVKNAKRPIREVFANAFAEVKAEEQRVIAKTDQLTPQESSTSVSKKRPVMSNNNVILPEVDFKDICKRYPQGTPEKAKKKLGLSGHKWIGSTCAVRFSGALQRAGVSIPYAKYGIKTVLSAKAIRCKGGDKKTLRYAFRVNELARYLIGEFRSAAVKLPFSSGAVPNELVDRNGIIIFKYDSLSQKRSGVTGHIDFWKGDQTVGFNPFQENQRSGAILFFPMNSSQVQRLGDNLPTSS